MTYRVSNRDARDFVKRLHPFQGNNVFGTMWCSNPSTTKEGHHGYVVYSYGQHWPLFVCIHMGGRDVWFENTERHSVTTSKHRSRCHPHCDTIKLSRDNMKLLIAKGYPALAKARILEGATP